MTRWCPSTRTRYRTRVPSRGSERALSVRCSCWRQQSLFFMNPSSSSDHISHAHWSFLAEYATFFFSLFWIFCGLVCLHSAASSMSPRQARSTPRAFESVDRRRGLFHGRFKIRPAEEIERERERLTVPTWWLDFASTVVLKMFLAFLRALPCLRSARFRAQSPTHTSHATGSTCCCCCWAARDGGGA